MKSAMDVIRERDNWTAEQVEAHRKAVIARMEKLKAGSPTDSQKAFVSGEIEYAKHATETQIKRMEA